MIQRSVLVGQGLRGRLSEILQGFFLAIAVRIVHRVQAGDHVLSRSASLVSRFFQIGHSLLFLLQPHQNQREECHGVRVSRIRRGPEDSDRFIIVGFHPESRVAAVSKHHLRIPVTFDGTFCEMLHSRFIVLLFKRGETFPVFRIVLRLFRCPLIRLRALRGTVVPAVFPCLSQPFFRLGLIGLEPEQTGFVRAADHDLGINDDAVCDILHFQIDYQAIVLERIPDFRQVIQKDLFIRQRLGRGFFEIFHRLRLFLLFEVPAGHLELRQSAPLVRGFFQILQPVLFVELPQHHA